MRKKLKKLTSEQFVDRVINRLEKIELKARMPVVFGGDMVDPDIDLIKKTFSKSLKRYLEKRRLRP